MIKVGDLVQIRRDLTPGNYTATGLRVSAHNLISDDSDTVYCSDEMCNYRGQLFEVEHVEYGIIDLVGNNFAWNEGMIEKVIQEDTVYTADSYYLVTYPLTQMAEWYYIEDESVDDVFKVFCLYVYQDTATWKFRKEYLTTRELNVLLDPDHTTKETKETFEKWLCSCLNHIGWYERS